MRVRRHTGFTAAVAWACAISLAWIAAPAAASEPIAAAAPVVDAGPDDTAAEGQQVHLNGVVHGDELVATSWTVTPGPDVDAGASCSIGSPVGAAQTTAWCSDDGHFAFTLTADDGMNPPVSDSMTATITNAPPDVLIIQPDTGTTYPYDAEAIFQADVYDWGLNDSLTCTVAWGDGATSVAMVVGESCTASHQYDPGFYHPWITAADDDGGAETIGPLSIHVTPPPARAAGWGFVKKDGRRTAFEFSARRVAGTTAGHLAVTSAGHRLVVNYLRDLEVSGDRAHWSGRGRWDGLRGYRLSVVVHDNRREGLGPPDRFGIVVRAPGGDVVLTTEGALREGHIRVRVASGGSGSNT
jgi:hypothetical protein